MLIDKSQTKAAKKNQMLGGKLIFVQMHCKYKGTKPWKWPLALISKYAVGENEVPINKKWFQPRFILKFIEKEKTILTELHLHLQCHSQG